MKMNVKLPAPLKAIASREPRSIPTWLSYVINGTLFAAMLLVLNNLVVTKAISTSNSKVLMLIGINIILAVSLNRYRLSGTASSRTCRFYGCRRLRIRNTA